MCRWDLSPAILLLFHPAAISCRLGLQIPPCDSSMRWIGTWFWQLQAWQTLAWAGPTGAALPKRWLGEKRKRQKGKGAEVLVLYGLYAEEPLSRTWGVQPKELCQVRRALRSPFPSSTFSWLSLRNTWSHLPPWAATLLKVIYWKSTYLGQEWSLSSMAMVVQNECPETGNIWELGIPKHPCGLGDLYSAISTSCQRKDRKSSEKLKITFRLSHKISIKIKT